MLTQVNKWKRHFVVPPLSNDKQMVNFTLNGDYSFREGTHSQSKRSYFFTGIENLKNCYSDTELENPPNMILCIFTTDNCSLTSENSTFENPNLLLQYERVKGFGNSYYRCENRWVTGFRYHTIGLLSNVSLRT